MKKIMTVLFVGILLVLGGSSYGQALIFSEDFESGQANAAWGLYRANEENVAAVDKSQAPKVLENGGEYVGYLQDADNSYNGAAIALAGGTDLLNYVIEGDVYCYANHPDGSAYTGLAVYSDSSAGVYIKLVADFDGDQRLRLYNNKLDMQTMQYTFLHDFKAADVPGGIPAEDGWHHMKIEVKTVDDSTTAFWCYFDGEMLAGCPIFDQSKHRMASGQFGLYAFQMDGNDGIPGYFDNIKVYELTEAIFAENFESGTANSAWELYRANEELAQAVAMSAAPAVLADGGEFVGYLQDADNSYNGAAINLAGDVSLQNYSIEGDVYCYVNHPDGSAYTGLAVYSDSSAGVYIKLVADFDSDQRLRLYNNKLDMQTMQYTFLHDFKAEDIPGGVPTADGWHRMKIEVGTIDENTTAFWCYFDGQMLSGCPILDTSQHQMDGGKFGIYAFQMDGKDGIPGYFDNIVVQQFTPPEISSVSYEKSGPTPITEFRLSQNYPNPFNPETSIDYEVHQTEYVDVTVYDMLGREIKNLVSKVQGPGSYSVVWNAEDQIGNRVPSGMYVYTLKTSSTVETRKMLLMK